MKQDLKDTDRWPYPKKDYLVRLPWIIVKNTIWKISWHRVYFLRMFILRIFGAKVDLKGMCFGSTDIFRPWDIELGENVTLGPRVHLYNLNRIQIGSNTVLSQDVYVCGGTHDHTKAKMPLLRKDVIIGDDVWIGAGAFIGPGIKIGNGAVVGARSVITKNVEPWTIVGGNPARFIKKREIK